MKKESKIIKIKLIQNNFWNIGILIKKFQIIKINNSQRKTWFKISNLKKYFQIITYKCIKTKQIQALKMMKYQLK